MRYVRPILICIAVLLAITGFFFWNNFVVQTEYTTVALKTLPTAFENFRIALLTDLHGREFDKGNGYLLQELQKAQIDLICISGDLFDEKTDPSMLKPLLSGLTAIAPTVYVTGNHEWQVENLRSVLRQMRSWGIKVLQNEYFVLSRGEDRLIIAGVDDPCGPKDRKTPQQLMQEIRMNEGENACIVMLSHRNDQLAMWAELGADLVLSGHCHGGVVRLPLVGAVFGTKRELFPKYDAGLYAQGATQLYVSRGLGYTNVRLRLFNRPHLPILTLVKKS